MNHETAIQEHGTAITLHAFASVKGGVGKSSLAVAAAHLLAHEGARRVVLIDCDLTGSSLADGLHLRAPDLPRDAQGVLDLLAAPSPSASSHLSMDDTTAMIDRRMAAIAEAPPSWVPFFNDALSFAGSTPDTDCNIAAMLWCDDVNERVSYLPSSSGQEDVRLALAWLYSVEPLVWTRRFAWILDRITRTVAGVTDIIIDLPPGLFGFSESVLTLLATLSRHEALPEGFPPLHAHGAVQRINAFLVSTPDLNDLFAAVRDYGPVAANLMDVRLVVNRDNLQEVTRRQVRRRFLDLGIEQLLHHLPISEGLGRLFRERRIRIDADSFWRRVAQVLRLEGADVAI